MTWLIKYRWPLLVAAALLFLAAGWRIDRATQYRQGHADATAMMQATADKQARQAAEAAIAKERAAADALAEKQKEIEYEKRQTAAAVSALDVERKRVQQYATRRADSLSQAAGTARTSDDDGAARGWQLFGACAAEYGDMAKVADTQRDALAEWQAYGSAVEQIRGE
ncbi:hypothetical protein PL75_03135 [Neisseria arctica]|uniref:Uncharacterized protein n=1 Tax=Neisseria arctica TaxID=1470200 RepID=A0A0J0YT16_9NEIS|nr:hypothetical protein [Neisseria arctica]KLT73241.1 hypothetical protein PL75_03135 [Neisseria arctica]UOO87512.1 hypothetical protein LVJ86_04505 [Neisseria arctica]